MVKAPKANYKPRTIWSAETIRKALDECTDSRLYIAMNLTFACSLRMGEIDDCQYTIAVGDGTTDGYKTVVDYTVIKQ